MTLTDNEIAKLCDEKEQELMKKHFGSFAEGSSVEMPETIGDYSPELPLEIETEYKEFLETLWKETPDGIAGKPLVFEEQKYRELVTLDDRELVAAAHKKASRRTIKERVTKTNYKDVVHYIHLLKEYTRELLSIAKRDFLEELTNCPIRNKAFE